MRSRHARTLAPLFLADVGVAAFEHLDQVPAKPGLHGAAHFAGLQGIHDLFKFRHQFARRHPAQVAALRGAAVLGVQLGLLGKTGAIFDAFLDFE